jgi:hypothetical protein
MYEVIWLRLAMAHFGVTTPIVSLVRRDYAVTVIATESSREGKRLLVNGVGITNLTPETKLMAHLPLAFLGRTPSNALDICFGMGTTHPSFRGASHRPL